MCRQVWRRPASSEQIPDQPADSQSCAGAPRSALNSAMHCASHTHIQRLQVVWFGVALGWDK